MSWKMLTRPKSMLGYSNAKEVLMPKNGGHFIFLVADGTFKLSGRDQVFRRTTSVQDHPARGEEHSDGLQRDSYGSQPLDTLTDDGEVRNDCWMIAGIFSSSSLSTKELKLYVPKEETFATPLEHIDVVRRTNTALDVLLECRIDDCWNVDGGQELSEPWDGFTQFTILNEKPPDGYMWSGRG